MKKSTVGLLLLVLLGSAAIVAWKFTRPLLEKKTQLRTSDPRAAAKTVRVGGDGYLGYWFLRSPEMQKVSPTKGSTVAFTDDKGAYAERLDKFARGEYEMIMLPINSYLEHGAKHQFPGVIVAAIGSSRGADALVGFAGKFPRGNIKELEGLGTRIVYTADSPSSFFMDLVTSDFDLPGMASSESWRVPVNGIDEVLKRAKRREGDAFVLWEPELSKALTELKDLKVILSSSSFDGYIVDVFVVSRDFLSRQPDTTVGFFESYFATVDHYARNRDEMLDAMKKSEGLSKDTLDNMLGKIDWFDLAENCQLQFGVAVSGSSSLQPQEGVVRTITSCKNVLERSKRLGAGVLDNPYTLVNPTVLKELTKRSVVKAGAGLGKQIEFTALDDQAWSKLRVLGSLNAEPVTFRAGDNLLDDSGKAAVDKIAELLLHNYGGQRIAIRGHTGPGDEEEIQKLSLERAEVVGRYLTLVHSVDKNRLRPEGVGYRQPPPRKPNEPQRAYNARLPRVEFVLLEGGGL